LHTGVTRRAQVVVRVERERLELIFFYLRNRAVGTSDDLPSIVAVSGRNERHLLPAPEVLCLSENGVQAKADGLRFLQAEKEVSGSSPPALLARSRWRTRICGVSHDAGREVRL